MSDDQNLPQQDFELELARSLSEYSQIAEPRGIEFSSVFASIPAMESSTLDGGFLGIEFSSESMIANTRTGS
jgi:hypothetical protein